MGDSSDLPSLQGIQCTKMAMTFSWPTAIPCQLTNCIRATCWPISTTTGSTGARAIARAVPQLPLQLRKRRSQHSQYPRAIELAHKVLDCDPANEKAYQHIIFCLAALSDPALVPQTVAKVFDLRVLAGEPLLTVLTDYFRAKELLLVLDNCEHLIRPAHNWQKHCSPRAPSSQILATSREALGLTGEVAWYVPSLEPPDPQHMPPLASLPQYDAIHLLVERARAAVPHWQLADHPDAAVRICCRLDGIPLAIELAAARLKVLSAEQIAERLATVSNCSRSRTALPRHRTLRATIDWSYDLLADEERVLFRRLAVFAGGWTLEAAEQVSAEKDEGTLGGMKDKTDVNAIHPSSLILHPSDVLDVRAALVPDWAYYGVLVLLARGQQNPPRYSRRVWRCTGNRETNGASLTRRVVVYKKRVATPQGQARCLKKRDLSRRN